MGSTGLDTPIGLSGLPGAATLRRHGRRLGITTVRDLLTHLPRRYEDLRDVTRLADLALREDGEPVTVRATVVSVEVAPTFRRRVQRTVALLRDESGEAEAQWFGRRFIERRLHAGDRIVASGKKRSAGWRVRLDNPEVQADDGSVLLHAGRIVPVYPLTRGISARLLRSAMRAALDRYGPYPEYLPDDVRAGRMPIGRAMEAAHFPEGFADRDAALLRLAGDELLALQVGMASRRRQRTGQRSPVIRVADAAEARLQASIVAALSARTGRRVALTADQKRAIETVRTDLARGEPMLRLLQGDVGSGKTAVAAYALGLVAGAGGQGALLAPTDLLARQLAGAVAELLADAGVAVTLLTGSLAGRARRAALDGLASGQAPVVVGTHALLQEGVSYARLELVVIDEQHRFGVAQREALAAKGASPHVMLMTATPIPRTLGQVLYADLDVSDLHTPPEGRRPVLTGIRTPADLGGTWGRVREEAAAGHGTFVVAPYIDAQEAEEALTLPWADDGRDPDPGRTPDTPADGTSDRVRSRDRRAADPGGPGGPAVEGAVEVADRLRGELAPLRVGLVHGRVRADERDATMAAFRDGRLDVLVGTTVLEVGVDVPGATMMVILDADRFGLSQLHQLRGRVGRGTAESYCVLVSGATRGSVAWERLTAVATCHDGFLLAEKDWELRREGDVLGLSQSGLPRLRVASLADERHRALVPGCRERAERLLDASGALRPGLEALEAELRHGWLASIASGEAGAEEQVGA